MPADADPPRHDLTRCVETHKTVPVLVHGHHVAVVPLHPVVQLHLVAELLERALLRVKTIEILDDASSILVKEIKPNFKTLGPRFGKEMKAVSEAIQGPNDEQIQSIEKQGSIAIEINGKNTILDASDVVIQSKDIEGWSVASEQGITVALDCSLTDYLLLEGIARELVNRIQNLRKDKGFEVTDTINVTLKQDKQLERAINANKNYVTSEVLAENILFVDTNPLGEPLSFDDIKTEVRLDKTI